MTRCFFFISILWFLHVPAYSSVYNARTLTVHEVVSSYGIKSALLQVKNDVFTVFDISMLNAGYAYDPVDKQGLANISAYILRTCDTKQMTNLEIQQRLSMLGAYFSYEVGIDRVSVQVHCLSEHLNEVLLLLNYKLFHHIVTDEILQYAKQHVKTTRNLQLHNFDPQYLLSTQLFGSFFTEHPYASKPFGVVLKGKNQDSIDNISVQDVRAYFSNNINRVNSIISVFGSITKSELIKILDKYMLELPLALEKRPKKIRNIMFHEVDNISDRISLKVDGAHNTERALVYVLTEQVSPTDASYYPMYIIYYILKSRVLDTCILNILPQGFREIPTLYSLQYNMRYSDMLALYFSTTLSNLYEYIDITENVLKLLDQTVISVPILKDLKISIVNSFLTSLEDPKNTIYLLRFMQEHKLGTFFIEDFLNGINNTTVEEINSVFRSLTKDKFTMVDISCV
ncbi:MAG: hypothetical protein P857_699 [Candidatus Xenolissoclinum pacificiensis L6]|uniref:Uncharacterized protein n=1 Tax=Candidatus Xenolissoclinum pacificiensis L6 TaxID=1401685 RepID=W2UZ49_9RICK|nr:MAG: hypothetical protein P857_699 [Candidatus Xenolissoclinum pacificiensis L6]